MKPVDTVYRAIRYKFIKEDGKKFLNLSDKDQHNIILAVKQYYERQNDIKS